MGNKLKLAFLLSSLVVSGAVLAQATPGTQATGAKAANPTQVAQGQAAGTAAGGQSSGVAVTQAGAATTTGLAAAGVPGAIAAGMTAIGAAGSTEPTGGPGTAISHSVTH